MKPLHGEESEKIGSYTQRVTHKKEWTEIGNWQSTSLICVNKSYTISLRK